VVLNCRNVRTTVNHQRAEPICTVRLRVSSVNGSCIFSRLFLPTQRFSFAPGSGEFLLLAAFEVTTSPGELAEKELLGHACANSFSDADRKISEHQPGTTIGSGIVKVCEAG
jgi:hypothetical protein